MTETRLPKPEGYEDIFSGIADVIAAARSAAARTVNAVITATYWEIGRRIVEFDQGGKERAEYGQALLGNLSQDLACSPTDRSTTWPSTATAAR